MNGEIGYVTWCSGAKLSGFVWMDLMSWVRIPAVLRPADNHMIINRPYGLWTLELWSLIKKTPDDGVCLKCCDKARVVYDLTDYVLAL